SHKHLLAACLSRLMTEDVLPNARNVKGFLFKQPELTVEALKFANRCWEIFDTFCRVYLTHRDDESMTCRQLLWMFKDLGLFDHQLTTAKLLELITAENRNNNQSFCVELEISFLEFFEVLLGCAELKFQQVSNALGQNLVQIRSRSHTHEKSLVVEKKVETTKKYLQMWGMKTLKNQDLKKPQLAGLGSILAVHQFFNHCFFPAVDHYWLVTRHMGTLDQDLHDGKVSHSTENSTKMFSS
ncbi:hypothetical protein ILYODFUR_018485, partial [Ilyodon furcidens]